MECGARAQKTVDQVRKSGGDYINIKKLDNEKEGISISIYIYYTASGWTARGAMYAYHPMIETVVDTYTCKGCNYSKKNEIVEMFLSRSLSHFPEIQQALGENFSVGSGIALDRLRSKDFDVVTM